MRLWIQLFHIFVMWFAAQGSENFSEKKSNGRKIARIALISAIFGPNESSRCVLLLNFFRKNETNEKFSKNSKKSSIFVSIIFFVRFWVGLGWIFVDFRMIFRRVALEPCATKTQKQDLKKEPRDPQRTSWLLRCGRASYCSHIFPNFFRTLHDQFFFRCVPTSPPSVFYHVLIWGAKPPL